MDRHIELRAYNYWSRPGCDSSWHKQSRPFVLLLGFQCVFSSLLNNFGKTSDHELLPVWGIVPFVIFLSWAGMSTSGHTKRVTVNAIVLIAYSVGNAAGPFMWQAKYKPRNKVPFAIISACSVASALTLLVTRQYLAHQNKKRDEEAAAGVDKGDKYDEVYITVMEDGSAVEKKVDRAFQDLTDLQNREFRYVL